MLFGRLTVSEAQALVDGIEFDSSHVAFYQEMIMRDDGSWISLGLKSIEKLARFEIGMNVVKSKANPHSFRRRADSDPLKG